MMGLLLILLGLSFIKEYNKNILLICMFQGYGIETTEN